LRLVIHMTGWTIAAFTQRGRVRAEAEREAKEAHARLLDTLEVTPERSRCV